MTSVLLFSGTLIAASVVVSLGVAAFFTDAAVFDRLGQFRATALGVAVCACFAFALFALMNPDPVSWPEPIEVYLRRTAGITIFSAFVWLPIFLGVFSALARRRRRV